MIRNVLSHVRDVETYGVLAVLIFFSVFLVALLWALRLKKPQLNAFSQLPLDGPDESNESRPTSSNQPRHE